MEQRIDQQLKFLLEVDKMKNIMRRSLIYSGTRLENDAEHSWHLALMAMVLYETVDQEKIDLCRVLKMALVHDLIEIYAGDTFAFDEAGYQDKAQRETAAAYQIFGMLPEDQGCELRALWQEFEDMETRDAQYAAAMDRLQPFLSNWVNQGHTWIEGKVTRVQVYKRVDMIRIGAPALWPFVEGVVEDSIAKGYILP